MSDCNAIPRFTRPLQFVGERVKTALTAAVVIIAIVAALLGGIRHSQAYADSPTGTRASQSSADASQTLRRYTLRLLQILSNADANKWARYWQARAHCDVAPVSPNELSAELNISRLARAFVVVNEMLCDGLERRLDVNPVDYPPFAENRTVGLLVNEPESMGGYILLAGSTNNYVHLIDHLGRVAHSWRGENRISHARLLDNGNLLVGDGGAGGGYSAIAELDPDGNIVWKYTHPESLHHDFMKMPNGNVLMLSTGARTSEEAIAVGANPDILPSRGMEYDYLIEMRPTGNEGGEIVWEWHAWDYLVQDFDSSKPNYGDPSDHPELIDVNFFTGIPRISNDILDWQHANAIDYNHELDQIALSPRQFSEVWIIDHSASTEEAPTRSGGNSGKGGALLYRWGNPRTYGRGTLADQRLFWQHHTHWIDPGLPGAGNILIFNNGYDTDGYPPYYSSIEEIVPPVDGYGYRREPGAPYPPSESIWAYTAEPHTDFYSRLMSGTQRLPNGNTLICEAMSGNLFQVTPDGRTVWRYVYPMDANIPMKQGEEAGIFTYLSRGDNIFNNAVYRAYWYAPDYPGLQKYDLTPGDTIELYE